MHHGERMIPAPHHPALFPEEEVLWDRLHTCSNATRYACRAWCYRQVGDLQLQAETLLVSRLDEISEELFFLVAGNPRGEGLRSNMENLEVWAFELEFACEESSIHDFNEDIDTLLRLFAEGCRIARLLLRREHSRRGIDDLLEFLDLVSIQALSLVVNPSDSPGLAQAA